MNCVWDLDGTLVETREANYQAYRSFGVTPPADFHVRPWQEWCSEFDHNRKNLVIGHFIRNYAKPGKLLGLWEANDRGPILSNASAEVVAAIRQNFEVLQKAKIHYGHNTIDKCHWLNIRSPGVYFDDSIQTVRKVREATKWTAILVQ